MKLNPSFYLPQGDFIHEVDLFRRKTDLVEKTSFIWTRFFLAFTYNIDAPAINSPLWLDIKADTLAEGAGLPQNANAVRFVGKRSGSR